MRRYLYKLRKLVLHNILHADDSPDAVARGVAAAMLVAFLPLVGFQTAIAIGLAALLRANKAVCVPIVWITNPLTLVPIYGACLALGQFVMSSPDAGGARAVLSTLGEGQEAAKLFEFRFWQELFSRLVDLGMELWVGCLIVGCVAAVLSYYFSRRGVIVYRERRRRKLLRRELFRSRHKAGQIIRRTEPR